MAEKYDTTIRTVSAAEVLNWPPEALTKIRVVEPTGNEECLRALGRIGGSRLPDSASDDQVRAEVREAVLEGDLEIDR